MTEPTLSARAALPDDAAAACLACRVWRPDANGRRWWRSATARRSTFPPLARRCATCAKPPIQPPRCAPRLAKIRVPSMRNLAARGLL